MRSWRRPAEIIGYDEVVLHGLPGLGHARQRGQRPPRELRQRPARRGRRAAGRGHPPRAAAGDHHLRRRPAGLPAPRPPAGARHQPARLRGGRRPRRPTPSSASRSQPVRSSTTSVWSRARIQATHDKFVELGHRVARSARTGSSAPARTTASPPASTSPTGTTCACDSLLAHATQVDPTSPFWFGLPREVVPHGAPLRRLRPGPQPGRHGAPRGRPLRRPALRVQPPPRWRSRSSR